MLQNQRAYQLIASRTHCAPLAFAVGACARAAGCCAAAVGGVFRREVLPAQQAEQLADTVPQLYPQPAPDTGEPQPLPLPDAAVDVSVIVPVHNGERFLRECLDSILHQNTARRIQLLAVEDGSADGSGAILEEYARRGELTVLHPEPGGSAARARNAGLLHAVGRWVLFVDCDDRLLPDAVETLAAEMERTGADIVQGGWRYLDEAGHTGAAQQYAACRYTGRRRLDALDLPGMPWGKLYRRELFGRVRFPAAYTCFEDAILHFLVFPQAECIAAVKPVVYEWRKNTAGLTATSQHTPKAVQAYWIAEEMLAQAQRLGLPQDEMFACNLTLQLANYCYVCVAGLPEVQRRAVFARCCALYRRWAPRLPAVRGKYAVRLAQRALAAGDYGLWQLQGRLFQLIN